MEQVKQVAERDYILESLKKMRDDYVGLNIEFEVHEKVIAVDKLIIELENHTEYGVEFRQNVFDMVIAYMSKFHL